MIYVEYPDTNPIPKELRTFESYDHLDWDGLTYTYMKTRDGSLTYWPTYLEDAPFDDADKNELVKHIHQPKNCT